MYVYVHTTHVSSAPLPNGQTESAKVLISQVSVNRTQLTKGVWVHNSYNHAGTSGHARQYSTSPHHHTTHTHTHTLGHTVYYSKTAHMTPPTQNHNCMSCAYVPVVGHTWPHSQLLTQG